MSTTDDAEPWPVGAPELCRQVLLDDPYGRVMVDAEGIVLHANPAFVAMVGRPVDEVVGTVLGRFFTPDSLRVGARVMAQVRGTTEEDIPVDLELERADGTRVPVEVGGHRYFDHPVHPGLHLRIRPATRERWMERFLTELVSGASLDTCLSHLARAIDVAIPGGASAVLHQWDGTAFGEVATPTLERALWEEGTLDPEGAEALPWRRAMASGVLEHSDLDDLPAGYRAAAAARGLRSCWAHPVRVPLLGGPAAAVVVWRDVAGAPLLGHSLAIAKLTDAVALAIERDQSRRHLERAATHDALTDLLNRDELVRRLGDALAGTAGHPLAVLYVDLDRFKPINDEHGHRVGDDLLAAMGRRLRAAVADGDDIARVGGDEFVVVRHDVTGTAEALALADHLIEVAARPVSLGEAEISVGASVGLSLAPEHGRTPVDLLDAADRALYAAKRAGRGCIRIAGDEVAAPR